LPMNDVFVNVNTHLHNVVDAVEADKAKYDQNVKELIADPQILARIIQQTVVEVEGMSVDEVITCIDADSIEVASVLVEPGLTNARKVGKIESKQTENVILNEGYVTFDVRCSLFIRSSHIKIIINVEAQKSSKLSQLGYHIENRIVFYLSRMISSQKGIEFSSDEYDNIKKVYSIWICMDAADGDESISKISLESKTLYGKEQIFPELDKMCGIVIRIRKRKNAEESKNVLIAMLEDLLADEKSQIKKDKLVRKYNMEMTTELRRRIGKVCNISDVILEEGYERGIEKGRIETLAKLVRENIISLEIAAEQASLSIVEFEKIVKLSEIH